MIPRHSPSRCSVLPLLVPRARSYPGLLPCTKPAAIHCQAFPDPTYAVQVLAVPASFACTLTQTNDSFPLLADSDGAGPASSLTRLLDIRPGVCGRPGSRSLACWVSRPDRPAARQQLHRSSPIFTDSFRHNAHICCPLTSCAPADVPHRKFPCVVKFTKPVHNHHVTIGLPAGCCMSQ